MTSEEQDALYFWKIRQVTGFKTDDLIKERLGELP